MEPRASSNPPEKPWVYVRTRKQLRQDHVGWVFSWVWNRTGPNRWPKTAALAAYPHQFSTLVGAHDAASCAVQGWTSAGTFSSFVLNFIFFLLKSPSASPQPVSVYLSSFICFYRKRSIWYCTLSEIVPNTQPSLSSSPSLPPGGSSSSSSSSSRSSI